MSMRESGAGTNNFSLAHMREERLRNLEKNQSKKTQEDSPNSSEMDYKNPPASSNNNDPQEFLESYKQDITANNSTEVEKVGSNLNTDLINNMETTDNNQFGSKTFSAVSTADKAAQNFFTDKKQLVLNAFK